MKLSRKTLVEFREHLVSYTFREIDDFFSFENIQRGTLSAFFTGQRRTRVEEYYSSLNFNNTEDIKKILKVFEIILIPLQTISLTEFDKLLGWVKRDGFTFVDNHFQFKNENKIAIEQSTIWTPRGIKLFISHRDIHKAEVKKLSLQLEEYGFSCFVAHDSIQPMTLWKYEIERGLATMDAMLCFITNDYYQSVWTNQEIGFAIAHKVPIFQYSADKTDPSGFLMDIQAIKAGEVALIETLIAEFKSHNAVKESFLEAFRNAVNGSFDFAKNKFIELHRFELDDKEIEFIVDSFSIKAKYINQLHCLLEDKIQVAHFKKIGISSIKYYRDLLDSHILSKHSLHKYSLIQNSDRKFTIWDNIKKVKVL